MRVAGVLLVSLCLGGCMLFGGGSPREVPPNPELERSRSLIKQAVAHPTVASHFKGELERARAALNQAVQIWNDERGKLDEDDEEWLEIRHLNHMARQRTAIAVMKARSLDAQQASSVLQSKHPTIAAHVRKPELPRAPAGTMGVLPPALQDLRPRQEPRGLVLILDDRYFEKNQAGMIGVEAYLDALLQYLVAHPTKVVACEGHSDTADRGAQSQRLSQLRARVVQQALLERGLEFSRVTAVGYGAAPGQGGARVELVISDTPPPDYGAAPP